MLISASVLTRLK